MQDARWLRLSRLQRFRARAESAGHPIRKKLFVQICEARGLPGKDRSGTCDAYCRLELGKQKDLDLEDLFTLGFNFIESQDEDERGLGIELLELVQTKQPRGKLAMAAKNKLKLAGD